MKIVYDREIKTLTIPRPLGTRILAFSLTVNVLLNVLLIFMPSFSFLALHEEVYRQTHGGLDPRSWFPFAWEGMGNALYLASIDFLRVQFLATPVIVALALLVKRDWKVLHFNKKAVYTIVTVVASLTNLLYWVFGGAILYWLLD